MILLGRAVRSFRYRVIRAIAFTAVVLTVLLLLLGAHVRGKSPLDAWHVVWLPSEFRERDAKTVADLSVYMARESTLFQELEMFVLGLGEQDRSAAWIRYSLDGISNPCNFAVNWNRTFVLEPKGAPRGAALLLHGLTDSPYSLRSAGEALREHGFHVVAPRLPGHGTVPGALTRIRWQDWAAAVRIAARHAVSLADDGSFVVVGYSNGAALALEYSLEALSDKALRVPDHIVLLSPEVGITRFARFSTWPCSLSRIPWLRPLAWKSVAMEIEPYKYNSFPFNAALQAHRLTMYVDKQLAQMEEQGALSAMPPILTFASLVDATVLVEDIVTRLYARLPDNGSELVIYDMNRAAEVKPFYQKDPAKRMVALMKARQRNYTLTALTDISEKDNVIAEITVRPGHSEPETPVSTGLTWPVDVYSLSHVALPFSPDDPIYGRGENKGGGKWRLGSLSPRGERGVLRIPPGYFLRLRYNPFFSYQQEKIRRTLSE